VLLDQRRVALATTLVGDGSRSLSILISGIVMISSRTYYLLLATDCLLVATCYLLLTTCYLLLATYCLLLTACYILATTYFSLLLACHLLLLTTCYWLLTTCYLLLITYYLLLADCYLLLAGDGARSRSRSLPESEQLLPKGPQTARGEDQKAAQFSRKTNWQAGQPRCQ
jgi:hypothetical protein